jgi:hypothetical protein
MRPFVPCKYHKTFFTNFQCSIPGLFWNLPSNPVTKAKSWRVHTWAYCRLSTAEAYGTTFIWSSSYRFLGHWKSPYLSPLTIGAGDALHLCILNLFKIFSMYNFWDSWSAPDPLGLKCDTITSPKRLVNTFIHQMITNLLKWDKPIKVAINFKSWSTTRDISSEWGWSNPIYAAKQISGPTATSKVGNRRNSYPINDLLFWKQQISKGEYLRTQQPTFTHRMGKSDIMHGICGAQDILQK